MIMDLALSPTSLETLWRFFRPDILLHLAAALVAGGALPTHRAAAAQTDSPEGRAVAYLRVEVPRWRG